MVVTLKVIPLFSEFVTVFMIRFGIMWAKNEATIFLRDLELIKKVQITDADSFTDLGDKIKILLRFNVK